MDVHTEAHVTNGSISEEEVMKLVDRILASVAPFAFVVMLASPALAGHHEHERDRNWTWTHSAPEINPAALGSAAALLAGGGFLLNARRKNRANH
jgi:hypothetical protein